MIYSVHNTLSFSAIRLMMTNTRPCATPRSPWRFESSRRNGGDRSGVDSLQGGDVDIEIRYFDDCPNWRMVDESITGRVAEMGIAAIVAHRNVESVEEAERLLFKGSPTVMINGEDPWDQTDAPVGLACRVYRTDSGFAGSPSHAQLREALEAAL